MTMVFDELTSVLPAQLNALVNELQTKINYNRSPLQIRNNYYEGTMRIASLGISIPPQLSKLKTVIGWPRVVVDAIDERLDVEGFRLADGTDADDDLWDIWQANNLDDESQLGHLDALILGSSYVCVGAGDGPSDQPIITVESALDMTCIYDARIKTITAAFRSYYVEGIGLGETAKLGTLYLPNVTLALFQQSGSAVWEITDVDQHALGRVPVVRMTNRSRISDRNGKSEITPEIISMTDSACRTLLGLTIAGEFYAAPQRWAMGVKESDFMDSEGNPKGGWDVVMGRLLALGADDDGNSPTVGQFSAYSPEAFTKVLDQYAQIMTSITCLPAEYLGITTSNPSSADAIRMNSDRLINRVKRKQKAYEGSWEEVMRLALLIRDGKIPTAAQSMTTLWRNPAIPTPAATSDAITKQIEAGVVPPTSSVVLARLDYTAAERAQLELDRQKDLAEQVETELASNLISKTARVDNTIDKDLTGSTDVPGTGDKKIVVP